MATHLTNIPHPIIPNLNQHPFDKKVKAKLVNQQQKLSQFADNIKQKKQFDLIGSKIPVRIPTLRHAYSEPSNIHQKNALGVSTLNRSRSEPNDLHRTYPASDKKDGLSRTQPNYQASQPRSTQYIQQAKDDKKAAYQSLPSVAKNFLNEKLSHKILVTFKKGLDGKEIKKFMVAYEEFKQGVSDKEKDKCQQIKLNGFIPKNRFQLTKTVWVELDKFKSIQTQEEITKIVANTKWSHLNR